MKNKLYSIVILLLSLCSGVHLKAEEYIPEYHSHNFYCHVEFNSGNIYPFAVWSMLSGVLNNVMSYNLFESGFAYDLYSGSDVRTKYNSPISFSATSLFNHVHPTVKLGYCSDYFNSSFNWGVLGTIGYKINQFKGLVDNEYINQNVQRAQFGGMVILSLGKNGGSTQALIELGARYNLGVKYKDKYYDDRNALNNGWTSHYALKFGGKGWLQNIGVYMDMDHYKMFNTEKMGLNGYGRLHNLKNTTLGICITVTPGQSETRREGHWY